VAGQWARVEDEQRPCVSGSCFCSFCLSVYVWAVAYSGARIVRRGYVSES
jgi:hypothetical protein